MDSNGEGSKDEDDKSDKKSKGDDGESNKGNDRTSPREEREDGHNNQLGAKVVATARTVVVSNGRRWEIDGSGNHNGWWRWIAMDGGSGDGQWRRNGWQNGKTIAMDKAAQ